MPRTVCVFGAAGWTGRAVVQELLSHGGEMTVRAFDLSAGAWDGWQDLDGPAPDAAELRFGDITDFETVHAAIAGCDAVIHTTVATTGDTPTSSANLYAASREEDATCEWPAAPPCPALTHR